MGAEKMLGVSWLCLSLACGVVAAQGEETGSTGDVAQVSAPVWEKGMAIIGKVRVDPVQRTVNAPGWVNLEAGAIELLACGPGGKTHESIFVLDVNALDLQTGLLLLGLKGGEPMKGLGQGPPKGAEIDLWVEWKDGEHSCEKRAETFVFDEDSGSVLPDAPWIFTGSMMEEGQFKALAEESLVTTYWDPWSIVNLGLPCGSNDEMLVVNTNTIPPVKTDIIMSFRAR
ncbi:MAG TPA: hypothetical protein DCZ95_14330 [Verrucomicrobia bacterium]|nr:MAG: hypothetical protein A2X46_03465 [Lentisphaerae bacterium GWF2_57_35]HBA85261.1 hypothetical protein [Verrucomicrobiota bacterium]